jgi:hypothetical protein
MRARQSARFSALVWDSLAHYVRPLYGRCQQMSRRLGANGKSDIRRQIRLTPEEAAEADGIAEYLEITFSDLVRESIKEKRKLMVAAGQRPPRRPRETGG